MGYIPYAIRLVFCRFRAKLLPMNDIICTISLGDEIVELVIEQVDPGTYTSVYCAVLQDEDGPLQTEYFELENGMEALDIIMAAMETIQNGIK